MNTLNHKIDFVALLSVANANPNGDPLDGNRPRDDYKGFGEITDVCLKRKIRNRMQDLDNAIFVQSDDRRLDDYTSLQKRAECELSDLSDKKKVEKEACEKWIDVRAFGNVFALKKKAKKAKGKDDEESAKDEGVSVGIRGPVSIHHAVSVSPIEIVSFQITKSVNGNEPKPGKTRSDDTMGMKHFVRFGLYLLKGSINVQLAEKTGFSEEDAAVVKECLRTLFVNDASSARPDGSMEVVKLFWFEHNNKDGQYSSAKVHRSVKVRVRDGVDVPESVDDYDISLEALPGLQPEVIEGV